MIRCLERIEEYREDIVGLWKASFADDASYIDFFLDNCPYSRFIAHFENGSVVSMLFLLDGSFRGSRCGYIYAACTSPEFRKRGLMGELIEYTKIYCFDSGYRYIFLGPGNEGLYEYYSRFGFVSVFQKQRITLDLIGFENKGCDLSLSDDLLTVKKALVSNIDAFVFDDGTMEYTIAEHRFNGGEVLCVDNGSEKSIAFYSFDGRDIYIKELLSDIGINTRLSVYLFKKYMPENIYILCPIVYNSVDNEAIYTKCGMICPANPSESEELTRCSASYAGMYLD